MRRLRTSNCIWMGWNLFCEQFITNAIIMFNLWMIMCFIVFQQLRLELAALTAYETINMRHILCTPFGRLMDFCSENSHLCKYAAWMKVDWFLRSDSKTMMMVILFKIIRYSNILMDLDSLHRPLSTLETLKLWFSSKSIQMYFIQTPFDCNNISQ